MAGFSIARVAGLSHPETRKVRNRGMKQMSPEREPGAIGFAVPEIAGFTLIRDIYCPHVMVVVVDIHRDVHLSSWLVPPHQLQMAIVTHSVGSITL